MIRSIEIENFQSHEHSILEFDKGLNVIMGTSHSGKSSIVRALQWALQNRPQGFSFRSHFAKPKESTRVAIEFIDDSYIVRERNKSENKYELPDCKLEALRSDVPEEVQRLSQITSTNIQAQGEPYFLLSQTPGAVGREFNRCVNLQIIDEKIKKANSIVDSTSRRKRDIETELNDIREKLPRFSHVTIAEKLLSEIDSLLLKSSNLQKEIDRLQVYLKKIEGATGEIKEINEWLSIETPFRVLKESCLEYRKLNQEISKLGRLSERVKEEQSIIESTKEWLKIEEPFQALKSDIQAFKNLSNSISILSRIVTDIEQREKVWEKANENVEKLIARRSEILKSDEFCRKCGAHQKYWRKR